MIFAYATDEHTLISFMTEAEATAYAEGIDVEDGVWLFFAEDGAPLAPVFTVPNQRGRFTVVSGRYHLQPVIDPSSPGLWNLLKSVASVHGELNSVEAVMQLLGRGSDRH